MYVKSIKLEDLRSFPSAELQFSKRINLIAGHNNAGKSSNIRALYQLQNLTSMTSTDIRLFRESALISIAIDNISPEARLHYFGGKNPLSDKETRCDVSFKIIQHSQEKKYFHFDENKDLIARDFHGLPT